MLLRRLLLSVVGDDVAPTVDCEPVLVEIRKRLKVLIRFELFAVGANLAL